MSASESPAPRVSSRWKSAFTLFFALAVLVPCLWGFTTKLIEFIALCRGDVDGAFAIMPVLNYLLASLGFLLLFSWAVIQGMFHDIERPKYTMHENEQRLDAEEDLSETSGTIETPHEPL